MSMSKKEKKLHSRRMKHLKRAKLTSEYIQDYGSSPTSGLEKPSKASLKKHVREKRADSQSRYYTITVASWLGSVHLLGTLIYRVWSPHSSSSLDLLQSGGALKVLTQILVLFLLFLTFQLISYWWQEDRRQQEKKLRQGRSVLDHLILHQGKMPIRFFFACVLLNTSILLSQSIATSVTSPVLCAPLSPGSQKRIFKLKQVDKFEETFEILKNLSHEIYHLNLNSSYANENFIKTYGTELFSNESFMLIEQKMMNDFEHSSVDKVYDELSNSRKGEEEKKKLKDAIVALDAIRKDGWKNAMQKFRKKAESSLEKIKKLQFEGIMLACLSFFISYGICFFLVVVMTRRLIESSHMLKQMSKKEIEELQQMIDSQNSNKKSEKKEKEKEKIETLAKQYSKYGKGAEVSYELIVYTFVVTNLLYSLYEAMQLMYAQTGVMKSTEL